MRDLHEKRFSLALWPRRWSACSCLFTARKVSWMHATDANGLACFRQGQLPVSRLNLSQRHSKPVPRPKKSPRSRQWKSFSSDDDRDKAPSRHEKRRKSTMAAVKSRAASGIRPACSAVQSGHYHRDDGRSAAKMEKPSSDDERDIKPHLATTKAKSTTAAAKIEPPASGHSAEPSDPVIARAKTAIAAKFGGFLRLPSSGEMKRAFRKKYVRQVRRHHLRPRQGKKKSVGRRCRRQALSVSHHRR